jgi:hypothetical protein
MAHGLQAQRQGLAQESFSWTEGTPLIQAHIPSYFHFDIPREIRICLMYLTSLMPHLQQFDVKQSKLEAQPKLKSTGPLTSTLMTARPPHQRATAELHPLTTPSQDD